MIVLFWEMLKLMENLVKLNIELRLKITLILLWELELKKNDVVTDILFAKTEFLENIKNYYEGDIYVNSDEERKLFMTYE